MIWNLNKEGCLVGVRGQEFEIISTPKRATMQTKTGGWWEGGNREQNRLGLGEYSL
jgi:hypothetical protein